MVTVSALRAIFTSSALTGRVSTAPWRLRKVSVQATSLAGMFCGMTVVTITFRSLPVFADRNIVAQDWMDCKRLSITVLLQALDACSGRTRASGPTQSDKE